MGDLLHLYTSATSDPVPIALEMLAGRSALVRALVSAPADHRLVHLGLATARYTLVLADTKAEEVEAMVSCLQEDPTLGADLAEGVAALLARLGVVEELELEDSQEEDEMEALAPVEELLGGSAKDGVSGMFCSGQEEEALTPVEELLGDDEDDVSGVSLGGEEGRTSAAMAGEVLVQEGQGEPGAGQEGGEVHLPLPPPEVQCVCGSPTADPLMLRCVHCCWLQHGACYRVVGAAPARHCCLGCSAEVPGRRCTDPFIASAIGFTFEFRRALVTLLTCATFPKASLTSHLGLRGCKADALVERLGQMGAYRTDLTVDHGVVQQLIEKFLEVRVMKRVEVLQAKDQVDDMQEVQNQVEEVQGAENQVEVQGAENQVVEVQGDENQIEMVEYQAQGSSELDTEAPDAEEEARMELEEQARVEEEVLAERRKEVNRSVLHLASIPLRKAKEVVEVPERPMVKVEDEVEAGVECKVCVEEGRRSLGRCTTDAGMAAHGGKHWTQVVAGVLVSWCSSAMI